MIPVNAVITSIDTPADTFSASTFPESRATNSGAVYWRVTACPIEILAKAVK